MLTRRLTAAASSSAVHCRSLATRRRYSTPVHADPLAPLLQVSTLPNGVRVATEATPGHFVAAGIYVDAGSRYESAETSGCSHMIDRMAFKSTTNRDAATMTSEIEALGGQFVASSSRETIMYQSTSYQHSLDKVMSLLSDAVLNPLLSEEELDVQREAARWEISEIVQKPEMYLPEVLHETAYENNTLGNALLCPVERIDDINAATLQQFAQTWYRPERIVVAGAGIPHDRMSELAQQYFGHLAPTPPSHTLPLLSKSSFASKAPYSTAAAALAAHESSGSPVSLSTAQLASAKSQYTGGERYLTQAGSEFTHVYVGFESHSIHHPDIYAVATLQMLLGGGSSFSAGGPGKGMYSRLYTTVLNRYHAVDYCSSFHHCYIDSGLFGIAFAVAPNFASKVARMLTDQLEMLTTKKMISEGELDRARNQLKSSLMMALESRMVQVEDLGRQVQVHGFKVPVEEMCAKIDAVTLDDLHRTANFLFRPQEGKANRATVVAQGNFAGLGDIRAALRKKGFAG